MQMLQSGGMPLLTDGVREADGSNPFGYFELEQVKTLDGGGDSGWLTDARGKAVKIVSPLLTYLPESYDYRVVFMRRELDAVIASQNAMLDARQQERGASDPQTRAYYEQHLQQIDGFLSRRACFTTLIVRYEDVLAHPAAQASRINDFLGGHLDAARMTAVVQPVRERRG